MQFTNRKRRNELLKQTEKIARKSLPYFPDSHQPTGAPPSGCQCETVRQPLRYPLYQERLGNRLVALETSDSTTLVG